MFDSTNILFFPRSENVLLNGNQLSGVVSTTAVDAAALTKIDLALNMFTGSLPSFAAIGTLQHLNVSHMKFTGTLPSDFHLLSQLESLDLSGNQGIDGTIPSGLNLLSNLTYFGISDTMVSGSLSDLVERLPAGIGK
jgi:Leucine-rich repeat (LRR) protein